MQEVYKDIFVGSKDDLRFTDEKEYAFVHATKTVFKKDDDEVVNEENNHLYLNWVDSKDSKYFNYNNEGVSVFIKVLDFIDKWINKRKVFLHCDEGVSRSPTIAMVYMAKRVKCINNRDYIYANRDFSDIYNSYWAGKGISDFVFKNWFNIK